MIIQKKNLKNTLFLDIETVSCKSTFSELSESMKVLWTIKAAKFHIDRSSPISPDIAADLYIQKAGIFAEFAKVVCISVGYLTIKKEEHSELRLKSFHGEEKDILIDFNNMLNTHYDQLDNDFLCGHNIKEFDIPFLCRRSVINSLDLPRLLNLSGKKPWQVGHLIDTMLLWRFGDYKNYTSLALLAGTLGIPSPKDDIDGSMVGKVFWEENDIERIVTYCEKDVVTVVQVVMKFAGMSSIVDDNIIVVKG